jgi:hypothetical protein
LYLVAEQAGKDFKDLKDSKDLKDPESILAVL